MVRIRGIDPDKVARYGKRFCKLIRMARENYQGMMGFKGDGPLDPNHRHVIDLSSDDDDDDDYSDDDDDGDDTNVAADFGRAADVQAVRPLDQRSGYFQSESGGNVFSAQPQPPRSTRAGSRLQEFTFQQTARPEPPTKVSRRPSSGPKQSNTRRGVARFQRRGGGAGGTSAAGRPSKRKSASARSSNGNAGTGTRRAAAVGGSSSTTTTTGAAARSFPSNVRGARHTGGVGGGGGFGNAGGIGGIGMMPT